VADDLTPDEIFGDINTDHTLHEATMTNQYGEKMVLTISRGNTVTLYHEDWDNRPCDIQYVGEIHSIVEDNAPGFLVSTIKVIDRARQTQVVINDEEAVWIERTLLSYIVSDCLPAVHLDRRDYGLGVTRAVWPREAA